jgi:hypothetical protein
LQLQDDLAEHVVASPIPYDADIDWDETSRFENYWDDLNYNGDGYDDYEVRKKRKVAVKKPSRSRKRKSIGTEESPRKRLKTKFGVVDETTAIEDIPPLLCMSFTERTVKFDSSGKVVSEFGDPVSLVPDWRERYKNINGFPKGGPSLKLEDVADDEEAADELYELEGFPKDVNDKVLREGVGFPEGEDDAHEQMEALHLDPEALKMALKEQLSAAGLKVNGMDEQTLLQFAERMFAGGGDDADDIAGELADDLLGRDEDEDRAGGLVDWVSKQMDAAKAGNVEGQADDEATKNDTDETATDRETKKDKSLLRQVLDPGQSSTTAVEPWPPPDPLTDRISPSKRKAARVEVDEAFEAVEPQPKRRAPSYAAPTAASKAKHAAPVTTNGSRKGKGK